MNCPRCGAGHRWIVVDGEGDDEQVYCEMCGYGHDAPDPDPDPAAAAVLRPPELYQCLNPKCVRESMLARMPKGKSDRWVHRFCLDCACDHYSTFTRAMNHRGRAD